jgi:hypothetical protein
MKRWTKCVGLGALVLGFSPAVAQDTGGAGAAPQVELYYTPPDTPVLDVPYVPTPQPVVDEMLRLAGVKRGDFLIDLGSGDGRIVVTAAKQYGVRGLGVDLNPERVAEANANAKAAGVTNKVEFLQGDLFEQDLSKADVVTMYLLPSVNEKLKPKLLRELRPGTRIVSHSFDMPDWEPTRTVEVEGRTLYLWIIPERGQQQPAAR